MKWGQERWNGGTLLFWPSKRAGLGIVYSNIFPYIFQLLCGSSDLSRGVGHGGDSALMLGGGVEESFD